MSRILVVDDDQTIHAALHAHLTAAGHLALHASSMTEAIRSAVRHSPELIVLNIMLPNTEGPNTLRWLGRVGVTQPVILLSDPDDEGQVRLALRLGGFDYVRKPIDFAAFDRAVAAALAAGERSVYLAPTPPTEIEEFFYRLAPRGEGTAGAASADEELLEDIVKLAGRLDHVLERTKAILHILRWEKHGAVPSWVSSSISAVLGYETLDRYNDPDWWRQRIHPEDRDAVMARLPLLHRDGRLMQEYRFRRHDGVYVRLREHLRLMVNEYDKPTAIIGLWLDLSEERQREGERSRPAPEPLAQSPSALPLTTSVPPPHPVSRARRSWANVTTPDGQPICPLCGAAVVIDEATVRRAEFVIHPACWHQMRQREQQG